jgi:hypothetical protein
MTNVGFLVWLQGTQRLGSQNLPCSPYRANIGSDGGQAVFSQSIDR